MKRILLAAAAFAAFSGAAQASGGFSCEADDKNVTRLVIEGATPRSLPGLINFGGILEVGDRKVEFKKSDVKNYFGEGGVIRVRAGTRVGDQTYSVNLNVRRNPKDEDDWGGTYEVTVAAAATKEKNKPNVIRGKVKCSVE